MKAIKQLSEFVFRLRHGIRVSNREYERLVAQVNDQSVSLRELTDTQLQQRFTEIGNAETSKPLAKTDIVNALPIIREAAERTLNMRPYDVQLLAALAIHNQQCVEMQTGEGKTLAAAVAVCLFAMAGNRVHVLTFNDYLSRRDAVWMGPLYRFLNLTVGYVTEDMSTQERQAAYCCDVTYVTGKEAGFDFLRDQLVDAAEKRVHQSQQFAIVDEADSILIDEARIPLVIATEDVHDETDLRELARLIRLMRQDADYEAKTSGRNVHFTDQGIAKLERHLGIDVLYSEQHADTMARLNLALQAEVLLHRDVDYIVRNNAIELIDELTGRVAPNRKWPGGLQAAIEAKEDVPILPQGRILNSITLQFYLERYEGIAGMTGTAALASEELADAYKLPVRIIEPNRLCIRTDHDDRIFATKRAKSKALLQEIASQHRTGRPVLVGTASVEESAELARQLGEEGVECRVLNASNDHLEAEIIADAGALGAVTISTNMAGRGTDIRLGGHDERTREPVVELGGLYVIGTNRHESRRIDNQLRGRAGRQGDPGESRFFISLEDDIIARHDLAEVVTSSTTAPNSHDQQIDEVETSKRIAYLQRVIEGECFEIRKTLRVYSKLLEVQRRIVDRDRTNLLTGATPPAALQRLDPALRMRLVEEFGEQLIQEVERKVTLVHLDWLWSDHLARAAEIREGIHLVAYGGLNPYDVFNKDMALEFDAFRRQVEEKVVVTISEARITRDGIDLEAEGLMGPSSTWTFTVNDNPRGAVLNQLVRGVVKRLGRILR